MRFCPFCSAENADELAVCQACGRRLPPLPPRRTRSAPATGVQLPQRTGNAAPPPLPSRRTGNTVPPPPGTSLSAPLAMPSPPLAPAPGLLPSGPAAIPAPARLPPPPAGDDRRALMNAISPGPAAQRREPPPPEPRDLGQDARRHNDGGPAARPGPPNPPPPSRPPPSPLPQAASLIAPGASFDDDFRTVQAASAYDELAPSPPVVPASARPPRGSATPTGREPPPTHIQRPEAHADRPFTPPKVHPVPEIPEPGLVNAGRYAIRFGRARWQRRGAIKTLGAEIKQDTEALDQVLGALGRVARIAGVDSRVFSAENNAINAAEARVEELGKESSEVDARKVDENSRFVDIERERNMKLVEAERMVDEAHKELSHLEAQRRGLRDKRKEIERRQRAYLKAAEDADRQSTSSQMGDNRQDLRRSAEQHRKEAAALEPDRQDSDRRLASLERPIGEATARVDAAKAELDAAKRSLSDAREGHTHRLDELDAEHKRKAREIGLAEGEIARRLVTLGTLVNLNRIEDPQFDELYQRIDRLRGAITSRTTEIERLAAEREAYDRGSLVRGISAIGGAFVVLIALIVILRAIL